MSNWRVPLFQPELGEAEKQALIAVIDSGWLTMGERTAEFERRFAEMVGVPHAVAVCSATAALHLALVALGVGEGDEVVCPSLTFVASANAVRYCGACPVFADVASMDDWNVCRDGIERLITPRTRALMVVHYAGYVCDMAPILELARERGLPVVEDAAHAPGACRDGYRAGAAGDIGCFSFFSNKNLTTGEGGMLTTANEPLAARLRLLRSHGMTTLTLDRHRGHAFSYDVVDLGFNYRMSEMNAALGLAQLGRLAAWNARRAELVSRYRRGLRAVPGLSAPFTDHPGEPSFHVMPVLLPAHVSRVSVMEGMKTAGVQTSIHYRPVHTFSAYREAGLGASDGLQRTEAIGERTITLPLYPALEETDVDMVCKALAETVASCTGGVSA